MLMIRKLLPLLGLLFPLLYIITTWTAITLFTAIPQSVHREQRGLRYSSARVLRRPHLLLLFTFPSVSSSGPLGSGGRLYSALGLRRDASTEDVKRAYKRLAMKWHPDKNPGNKKESEKRFKEINEAYHILSNAKKREQYDVAGDENFDSSQARGGPSSMAYRRTPGGSAGPFPGGAFRSGQWTTFSGSSRPQRSGYTQFETMFDGGIGGVGGNFDSDSILGMLFQNMFNGASGGARGRPQRHPFGGQEPVDPPVVEKELFCSLEEVFSGCKKTLRLKDVVLGRPVQRDVVVEVRPGWKAGTRITFKATSSFPVAIVFVLKIRDHAYLQRRGDDLVWKCSLTSGQVAKGVSIKVPMIDGTTVVYNTTETDTPILSGHKRVFPNLGMPISKLSIVDQAHKRTRGDFILEFEVRNN